MVSFKNGILRIEKSEKDRFFRFPFEICFYLGFIFYFLAFSSLHYVGVALMITGTAIMTSGKLYYKRINSPVLSAWYLLFLIYAEMSSIWAYSPSISALKYVRFMMLALVYCFGIIQYVDSKKDLERLLNVILYAALTIAIIEFVGTPFNQWFSGYFGSAVGGGNTNTFGFILLYASMIAFYKAYILHKKIWYPAVLLFLSGCVLSSSRKAVFMSVFGILMIILFAFKRKHHLIHFILALIAAGVAFTIIMTNQTLYDAVGNRIETLIAFANNETTKYGSLQYREYYIEFAKVLFKRKPVTGHGFANFATLLALETTAKGIYAHNNYWEILADLGIIGFILYYWIYVYMFIKLAITFFRKKFTYLKLLAITMLVSELILEWGVITMYSPIFQTIIAFMFCCCTIDDSEDKKLFFYSESQTGGK